jgi:hypothetical protein
MKTIYWILIIIVIFLVAFSILYKNYKEDEVVGYSFEELEINKNELKECCEYYEEGKLKTCAISERFDCNLCDSKCSS